MSPPSQVYQHGRARSPLSMGGIVCRKPDRVHWVRHTSWVESPCISIIGTCILRDILKLRSTGSISSRLTCLIERHTHRFDSLPCLAQHSNTIDSRRETICQKRIEWEHRHPVSTLELSVHTMLFSAAHLRYTWTNTITEEYRDN